MRKKIRWKRRLRLAAVLGLVLGLWIPPAVVSAQGAAETVRSGEGTPTSTYTRDYQADGIFRLRLSREMYLPAHTITASTLGLEETLEGITDLCCTEDGTILLLCGGTSRLIRINPDYSLKDELIVTDSNGEPVDFTGAGGIYSDPSGMIYLADTDHARILKLDGNGRVLGSLERPQSELIPEEFMYQPAAVAKDPYGYLYILSRGSYYGALLYTPEEEFLGFYGASQVSASALDTLSFLWEKLTSNETKKAASVRKLPYSFVDFDFDPEGYLVTCTGNTGDAQGRSNGVGQLRKISPNGENILYKRGQRKGYLLSDYFNFLEDTVVFQESTGSAEYRTQTVVSVAVSADGFLFALDSTNGMIYLYDSECNLMCAFGGGLGSGAQAGVFWTPVALALDGDKCYVADYGSKSITVFDPTEYGLCFRNAQRAYLEGDYEEAREKWEWILSMDRGNQQAYRGLAMASYNAGDYERAADLARQGYDYAVYDLSWRALLSGWIARNFVWLLLGAALLLGGGLGGVLLIRKKRGQLIKSRKGRLLLMVPFHPFASFTDLKYQGLGSWPIGLALTLLCYGGAVLKNIGVGFLYTYVSPENYNALYTLGGTAGLLVLWSVCNWLVCSMFDGKGSLKEVYTATAYALAPLILYTFLEVLSMRFLPLGAAGVLSGLHTAMVLFTFFLLSIAILTVHEYDFFKFLWTGLITIAMMILVVFVLFMCTILLMQFGSFLYSVYEEVFYR